MQHSSSLASPNTSTPAFGRSLEKKKENKVQDLRMSLSNLQNKANKNDQDQQKIQYLSSIIGELLENQK